MSTSEQTKSKIQGSSQELIAKWYSDFMTNQTHTDRYILHAAVGPWRMKSLIYRCLRCPSPNVYFKQLKSNIKLQAPRYYGSHLSAERRQPP
jgi:hypothetical protein